MKYPKFLNNDSTLYFLTTSFSCNIDPYKTRLVSSINFFENNDYKVKVSSDVYEDFDTSFKDSKRKASIINNAFTSKEDYVLLSVGGGELMYQLLNYLDFESIKNNPKWFMGYSDNTNLTFLLPILCDVASIYAVNAPDFGIHDKHKSIYDALSLLRGEKLSFESYPKYEYTSTKKQPLDGLILEHNTKVIGYPNSDNQFSGRIIGGCLDILLLYLGTKFDKVQEFSEKYKDDKIIWFFEACDLSVVAIRRAILQLKNAGWFKNVSGIIIGRPLNAFNDKFFDLDRHTAIIDVLSDLNVPIIFDADIGHVKPSIPIICGSFATITTKENKLFIDMKLK